MNIDISSVFSLFLFLIISCLIYLLSMKWKKIPYTVMLVIVGFFLAALANFPVLSFLDSVRLTPELLFYIFLPALIFESAYKMNIREVMESIYSIAFLSIGSMLISTLAVGFLLSAVLTPVGISLPIIVALIFGAIISSTDPVAVLALFKDYGAPRRLSLIFEGESLFNDGTAVALFLVLLEIAQEGFHGVTSVLGGIGMFISMVIGGIVIGITLGSLFSHALAFARKNEFVTITIMLAATHLTFIISELLNAHVFVFGYQIHISSIIATTMAAITLGNVGRHKLSPKATEYIEKFWGQTAFFANSIIFILIGLMFASTTLSLYRFIVPVLITLVVVAIARAVSIYPIVGLVNRLKVEPHIPLAWQHLLSWGSLRGALALIMVFLIPDTFTVEGWTYAFSIKELLLALVTGCILATLFINATTIAWVMKKLKINDLDYIDKIKLAEAIAFVKAHVLEKIGELQQKEYISESVFTNLQHRFTTERNAFLEFRNSNLQKAEPYSPQKVLELYAVGLERHYLRQLYVREEITELIYRRILGKLSIQEEKIEQGMMHEIHPSIYHDRKDIFERIRMLRLRLMGRSEELATPDEKYMYYRAQNIIARKASKDLREIQQTYGEDLFDIAVFDIVTKRYDMYRQDAAQSLLEIEKQYPDFTHELQMELGKRGVKRYEEEALDELFKKDMIPESIYSLVQEELSTMSFTYIPTKNMESKTRN